MSHLLTKSFGLSVTRTTFPRLLIVLFLLYQFFYWALFPRISSGHPGPHRSQALIATEHSPQSVQEAAFAEASRLDGIDNERKRLAEHALVVGMDIAIIYFFWNYGIRKPAT
jgi:hypothetical protein